MNNPKTLQVGALVCSLVGLVLSFFVGGIAFSLIEVALCVIGIVLGAKGMKAATMAGQGKGMAIAGLVLGIIGVVFASVNLICAIACAAAVNSVENELGADLDALENELSELENMLN